MNNIIFQTFNRQDEKQIVFPETNKPISTSEKLVREEVKKLNENTAEIKELIEEMGKEPLDE